MHAARAFLAAGLIATALSAMTIVDSASADAGIFATLSGNWSGAGTISTSTGSQERIRCRATYDVDSTGNQLRQQLRCASDSFKFEVNCNIVYADGAVTGTWSELTRNAVGQLTGLAGPGRISGGVAGSLFSAKVAVITNSGKQSVSIEPMGSDVTKVFITMSKK